MIRKVVLDDVAGIAHLENPMPFAGVNVILGKNDMGKTILLKMLYSVAKSLETYTLRGENSDLPETYDTLLASKIQGVYGRNRFILGDLVRKNGFPHRLSVKMEFDNSRFDLVEFSYGVDSKKVIKEVNVRMSENLSPINAVFVPANEVLSAFAAIKAMARLFHYPGYDDTTLDLIELLDIPETSQTLLSEEALSKVQQMFGGELKQVDSSERFVFRKGNNEYRMFLTAEGVKHIGVLGTLLKNGSIRQGTILFLDEPENNLHPSAVREFVKLIVLLSKLGVQVFLTTHNYFVLKQLQNESIRHESDIVCCSLSRGDERVVEARFANLKEEMPDNDIVRESLMMYDEDIDLSMR